MITFTVDSRAVFTVHKAGCAHLRRAAAEGATFDVEAAEPTRASITAAIGELGSFFDDGADLEFGPCLKSLPA